MATQTTNNDAVTGRDPHVALKSPRETLLPFISRDDASKLAYPPNVMPGQRDVTTPYGTIRVNEWGPETGRKVLFIHGDSTPSPLWSKIAYGLTKNGCRVMTFDLWGRGYSDTPLNVVFDVRIYSSQVLWAITSSPLPWTGDSFSIIGFSLGGGIAVDFASTYPQYLNSVILLAPVGLLRQMPGPYGDYYIQHPDEAPTETYMRELAAKMLEVELDNPQALKYTTSAPFTDESKPEPALLEDDWRPAELSMAGLVQWQWDYHKGAMHAFLSSAKNGAIQFHYNMWKRLAEVLAGKPRIQSRLRGSRILVIQAEDDTIVIPSETREDILKFVPEEHVEFAYTTGGHGFVYPQSQELIGTLLQYWNTISS